MSFSQFTKLVIICNICFIITLLNHRITLLKDTASSSSVIILGQFISVVVNIIYFLWLIIKYKNNFHFEFKKLIIPIVIMFIFIIQIFYFFIY